MSTTDFPVLLAQAPVILGEGAVIERLRRTTDFELDPHVVNSAFIYEEGKRSALEAIYRQYLDIGARYDLPLVLSTPTWRASRERIAAAGFEDRDLNADNFKFLDALRRSYGEYGRKVAVCGLLSCRGDAYNQREALTVADAQRFHAWQAARLADAGVDFLLAATLPAVSEATGLASALAATGKPYIVSFVFRPEGTLIDGTPLKDAMAAIDAAVDPKPLAFMANCTHASIFRTAIVDAVNSSAYVRRRVIGLFANTAALTPEALDNSDDLIEEQPETFADDVGGLHSAFGMKVLGGCCGTDDRHIRHLAMRLISAMK